MENYIVTWMDSGKKVRTAIDNMVNKKQASNKFLKLHPCAEITSIVKGKLKEYFDPKKKNVLWV